MRYELRAAYLKLLTYLHLDHEVTTRLLMRGEFILPRSECTDHVPLFSPGSNSSSSNGHGRRRGATADDRYPFCLKSAPLPGSQLVASCIRHSITSSFSQTPFRGDGVAFSMEKLKEFVLGTLESLLHSNYYKMYLLPADTRSPIFVPMIEALDNLLVMGVLSEERDLERLLHLLDPAQFPLPGSKSWRGFWGAVDAL